MDGGSIPPSSTTPLRPPGSLYTATVGRNTVSRSPVVEGLRCEATVQVNRLGAESIAGSVDASAVVPLERVSPTKVFTESGRVRGACADSRIGLIARFGRGRAASTADARRRPCCNLADVVEVGSRGVWKPPAHRARGVGLVQNSVRVAARARAIGAGQFAIVQGSIWADIGCLSRWSKLILMRGSTLQLQPIR